MTDKTELRRLAQRVIDIEALEGEQPISSALDEFQAAGNPEAVLALIAENEQSRVTSQHWKDEHLAANAVIDQLKADIEALRNALRPLLAHWDDLRPGESLNVDAARAAMGKGEPS